MTENNYYYGTGKRKTAIARVRLYSGEGPVIVNGKSMEDYFPRLTNRNAILDPLRITNTLGSFHSMTAVAGGGINAQAEAIRHGLARALVVLNPEHRVTLKQAGFLTRDARVKERKKPGLKRARKAPQYTKR
ncbi:MAG: 30S ribosomal protein S9 [Dehalococcoidia bacterium]|jgi:small subunit ribosomal protein S9|nr:30S ribosomal protein S9 [Dehalococcoidia bacterium]